jgi:hypothetical protein
MMSEWHKLDQYLDHVGVSHDTPTLCQTDGSHDVCPMHAWHPPNQISNHYKGLARDYGDTEPNIRQIVAAFRPLWDQGKLLELYYAPTGTWLPSNVGDHTDHAHVAIKPGAILVPAGEWWEMIFKDDNDARNWFVRWAFNTLMGREPNGQEQTSRAQQVAVQGADVTWAALFDSDEAKAYRASRHG